MKTDNKKEGTCNYCGSSNFYCITKQADIRYFPDEVFTVNKCKFCGILFTLPNMTINQLNKYYPDSYGAYNLGDIELILNKNQVNKCKNVILNIYENLLYEELNNIFPVKLINAIFRGCLDILQKTSIYLNALPVISGRYLHIGSGNPYKFARYKAKRIEIHTIDINRKICEIYSGNGIISNHGTIESVEYPENYFDVIYFSHVIEHLLNPKKELKKLCNWIKKDGFIVCSFPIYNTLEWNYKKPYYDVPRHRIHIDKKSAKMIFRNADLKIIKKIFLPYGQGFHQNSFLNAYLHNNLKNKDEYYYNLKKKYIYFSYFLSLINQSGDVIYYLKKTK